MSVDTIQIIPLYEEATDFKLQVRALIVFRPSGRNKGGWGGVRIRETGVSGRQKSVQNTQNFLRALRARNITNYYLPHGFESSPKLPKSKIHHTIEMRRAMEATGGEEEGRRRTGSMCAVKSQPGKPECPRTAQHRSYICWLATLRSMHNTRLMPRTTANTRRPARSA